MKLENVSFTYSPNTAYEIHALKNVNLDIRDGEFIGLIGHTGSGKSTLVQHFNGLMKATSGAIYYNGENIYAEGYSMKQLRGKVGLVFQYPEHQLFEVDVLTDVCFGPKNLGLSKEEAEKRARKALQMVGLKEKYYKQSPFELSGGQKRRVAIAGVLAMKPDVLILDELLGVVDNQIIMFDGSKCTIYNQAGTCKYEGELEMSIKKLFPVSGFNKYMVISTNGFQEIQLVK